MPTPFLNLLRESFFRPRNAARYILTLDLPRDAIVMATLLISILTVLSQFLLFTISQSLAEGAWTVTFSMPIGDVALQFISAYLVAQIVVMLARAVKSEVTFADSIAVYLWFNFLLVILLSIMVFAIYVLAGFGLLLVVFALVWLPYALAVYWAELLQTKNLFLGFVVAVVAFLIASAISVVVAGIIGLPVMEIIPNV